MAIQINKLRCYAINVNGWNKKATVFGNLIRHIDPDIIAISEHGLDVTSIHIKVHGYNILQKNDSKERFDGVALGIKHGLRYKEVPDLEEAYLAVKIETTIGELVIAVGYQPPRRNYLPINNFIRLFRRPQPAILLGDLNARCRASGYTRGFNNIGKNLELLINRNVIVREGPEFPTFFYPGTATTPEIVLTNNNFPFNLLNEPSPHAPSDHIGIITTISASPIQVPIPPRKSLAKTDWEKYREVTAKYQPATLSNATLEEIDEEVEKIIHIIMKADEKTIPKIGHKTLPYPRWTPQMYELKDKLEEVHREISEYGPSYARYIKYRHTKSQLKDALTAQQNNLWNEIISNTDIEKDPRKFWNTIKRLRGSTPEQKITVKNAEGRLIEEPAEVKEMFRNYWKKVFSITPEENENFDTEFEEEVIEYLNNRNDSIHPHNNADENRIQIGEGTRISNEEILLTIKTFSQKAQGEVALIKDTLQSPPQTS